MNLKEIEKDISNSSDNNRAKILQRFFKTGKGEYAEGDIFVGIDVPTLRRISKKYKDINIDIVLALLHSKIHEERLLALYLLLYKFENGSLKEKKEIFNIYLSNTKYINNWDLVDTSARDIIGGHLYENIKNYNVLIKLAKSEDLWERRIAIISTYYYIMKGDYSPTFTISKILINDKHDLIQKAVGWMLREVGKRISPEIEKDFINENIKNISRVSLSYAIEHFNYDERKKYLELRKSLFLLK